MHIISVITVLFSLILNCSDCEYNNSIRGNGNQDECLGDVQSNHSGVPKPGDAWFLQKRNTFVLQVIQGVTQADLDRSMGHPSQDCEGLPSDVADRVDKVLSNLPKGRLGETSDPQGMLLVRKAVTQFIAKRDNSVPGDPNNIYLTNGVFGAATEALKLLNVPRLEHTKVGIVAPSPLYPVYNRKIRENGYVKIQFNLNPEAGWDFNIEELQKAFEKGKRTCSCHIRGMILVNPDNPTGKIFTTSTLRKVVRFAYLKNLLLIVDEVFQQDVLRKIPFISIRKVLNEMSPPFNELEVISMHSISKGHVMEAGYRGGYMELLNVDKLRRDYLEELLIGQICANMVGQVALYAALNPPKEGEPSFDEYREQKDAVLQTQMNVAHDLCHALNQIQGWSCSVPQGGKGLFNKVLFPEMPHANGSLIDKAFADYFMTKESIVVLPGSRYGLAPVPPYGYIKVQLPTRMDLVGPFACKIQRAYNSFNQQYGCFSIPSPILHPRSFEMKS